MGEFNSTMLRHVAIGPYGKPHHKDPDIGFASWTFDQNVIREKSKDSLYEIVMRAAAKLLEAQANRPASERAVEVNLKLKVTSVAANRLGNGQQREFHKAAEGLAKEWMLSGGHGLWASVSDDTGKPVCGDTALSEAIEIFEKIGMCCPDFLPSEN